MPVLQVTILAHLVATSRAANHLADGEFVIAIRPTAAAAADAADASQVTTCMSSFLLVVDYCSVSFKQ